MKAIWSIVSGLLLASTAAAADTIEVRPGQSIQDALNRAKPGDTVAVRSGTYQESVYASVSGVKLVSADGKGAAHIVSSGTPLFIQGGSGNEIRGFTLTAGKGGNGIQVGGTVNDFAKGYVVADNTITNAGEDGIKVHQASGFTFTGNVIQNAGTGGGRNHDGGIDFVAVTDSRVEGNAVVRTGGNSCLMLKGGTARNQISGNSFAGCKDGIHVGGLTDDQFAAPGSGGKEAYGNTITGNKLCAGSTAVYLFPGEGRRKDNAISGNSCSGVDVGPIMTSYEPLDAEQIARDIEKLRRQGMTDSAIEYIMGMEGITIPREVLNGMKSVADAIEDKSISRQVMEPKPPALPPSPVPDLSPKGSSAAGWTSNFQAPSIQSMRQSIMGTKPPRC